MGGEIIIVQYVFKSIAQKLRSRIKISTLGITIHCDRDLAVSKQWEPAAATTPENPAARLTARGSKGPTSSLYLPESAIRKKKDHGSDKRRSACHYITIV